VHAQEPQPTDKELVQLCRQQSREAYGLLVTRYARTVRAIFLARLGRHRDLDDMVQETFLRAYKGLERLQDGSRFAPYLHRIAQNMAVDQLRRRQRREVSLDEIDLEAPETEVEDDERMRRLRSMVGRLPEALREAVFLFYFEEMSYARMASALGITEAAVNQRLSRARKKLRTSLGVTAEQGP
jgi:RNA polymerase sigma-70 factor (ECF subfamily)